MSAQQSVNAFAGAPTEAGGAATSVEGTSFSDNPSVPADLANGTDLAPTVPNEVSQTPFPGPRPGTGTTGNGNVPTPGPAGYKLIGENLAETALLTAGAATALGLCVWLMLG